MITHTSDLPDPRTFGRALAERAMTRMSDEEIGRAEVAPFYAQELAALAHKMTRGGADTNLVADWLESVTAAFRERLAEPE